MARVTVVLTTWNQPAMLREAIQSVIDQTFQDWELLLLDDNSDDPAQAKVLEWAGEIPGCTVARSRVATEDRRNKVRYAVLANVGLKLAKGEYITYLCDDDYYLPHRLEKMVARLDEGDAKVVYGAQLMLRDGKDAGVRAASSVPLADAFCVVDHSSVMHVTQIGRDVGGWDTDPQWWGIADAVFWRRLNQAGYMFYPILDVLDVHRFHGKSVSAKIQAGQML